MKRATPLVFSNPRTKRVCFDKDNGKASLFKPGAVSENHFHLGSHNYAVVSDFADVARIHLRRYKLDATGSLLPTKDGIFGRHYLTKELGWRANGRVEAGHSQIEVAKMAESTSVLPTSSQRRERLQWARQHVHWKRINGKLFFLRMSPGLESDSRRIFIWRETGTRCPP
ncbi:PC4 domain-containing protein [Trichonephila clavipes]|nr:PC4 domain-containing protein [Trichonephila clavipes]